MLCSVVIDDGTPVYIYDLPLFIAGKKQNAVFKFRHDGILPGLLQYAQLQPAFLQLPCSSPCQSQRRYNLLPSSPGLVPGFLSIPAPCPPS